MRPLKFGVGLWCMGFSADRFIPKGYKNMGNTREQLEMVSRVEGAEAIQIHFPDDFLGYENREVSKMVDDFGLKISTINVNLFGDPIFRYGAFTNADGKIRRKAIDLVKRTVDTAREIECGHVEMWPGQDGWDYVFQSDYTSLWNWTVSAIREITEYAPDLKLSYEYKLKEPRMYVLVSNVGKALYLTGQVGAGNFGIALDFGHALLSREAPAEALCLLNREGKLFNVHINDAYGEFDDDLIAGTINVWRAVEYIWYLKQTDYDGFFTLDQFPFREDSARACTASIRMLKSLEKIADRLNTEEIKRLQSDSNIIDLLDLLRRQVLEGEGS
ncbi:MAG TPA: sugar phosphate isomerase/epimerase family protein [Atribacteraceae bacterium]|nr:sugar phosphate isomerase/epimerase family protein [Atribacteraceae bacterium]